ncbi:MAG: hypothetical protein AABM33_06845 [Pseudomonadota bacterium]
MKRFAAGFMMLLAGCASFDGRGLVPEQSTAQDVAALMGTPADRITVSGGDTIWYYPRAPMGMHTFAVRMSSAGVLRSIDQLLTEQNLRNLVAGVTTGSQVREVLGPPWRTTRTDRMQRDVWEYSMLNSAQWPFYLYVQLSYDGIVREVLLLKDYSKEPGGDGAKP